MTTRPPIHADDVLPVMLWCARPDMSCEFVNRQWLDFTGYEEEQALGDGWSRAVHPEDLPRWLDTCLRAFDARESYEIEYRLRRRDGEYRWVLERGEPRHSADGSFVGFAASCLDIDERKHAEHELARSLERERRLRAAAEEASRAKDGLLASVLANLESPARAIASWTARLRGATALSGEAARALEEIEDNCRAQTHAIASLLELTDAARSSDEPVLAGLRVLIIEDDEAARDSMTRVLGVAGAQTCATRTTHEALEAIRGFRPDVILSGIGLDAERVSVRAARDRERDAQLTKPFEPVALLATVARVAQPARL